MQLLRGSEWKQHTHQHITQNQQAVSCFPAESTGKTRISLASEAICKNDLIILIRPKSWKYPPAYYYYSEPPGSNTSCSSAVSCDHDQRTWEPFEFVFFFYNRWTTLTELININITNWGCTTWEKTEHKHSSSLRFDHIWHSDSSQEGMKRCKGLFWQEILKLLFSLINFETVRAASLASCETASCCQWTVWSEAFP